MSDWKPYLSHRAHRSLITVRFSLQTTEGPFTLTLRINLGLELNIEGTRLVYRVPTRPGKPGKMRVHLENLEISWNFEKFNKYHGKMT